MTGRWMLTSISMWALLALPFLAAEEPVNTPTPEAPPSEVNKLEVKVLEPGTRLLLCRGKTLLLAAQLRTVGGADAPVLAAGEAWDKAVSLTNNSILKQIDFKRPGVKQLGPYDMVSALMNIRRVAGGVRFFVDPSLVEPLAKGQLPAEMQMEEAAPPAPAPVTLPVLNGAPVQEIKPVALELAVELFGEEPKDKKPEEKPGEKIADALLPHVFSLDDAGWLVLPQSPEALPKADGKSFRARCISLGLGQGDKNSSSGDPLRRIELARSAPADWTLVKLQKSLLLRQGLRPDPRDSRKPGSFLIYLGDKWDENPPEVSPVRLSKQTTPIGDFIEGYARVFAGHGDPYGFKEWLVQAEIGFLDPETGEINRVLQPCFFWEGPSAHPAEGEFRFRFAPSFEGPHEAMLKILAPSGQVDSVPVRFQAGPAARAPERAGAAPASNGFITVQPGEKNFRFKGGGVFMPLGLNLAWPQTKGDPEIYRTWFKQLIRNGGNFGRIWISSWGLPLEGPKPGQFDPDVAWSLDEIFTAAQARDVYLMLAAENSNDLTKNSSHHPYFREMGGPLISPDQFFHEDRPREMFKRRLTYLAARYGAFRSLFAWELINEVDEAYPNMKPDPDDPKTQGVQADRARLARRRVQEWAVLMADHLATKDSAHGHMITISTALPPDQLFWDLDRHPRFSFIQAHGYIPDAQKSSSQSELDEAALLTAWIRSSREAGRPKKPFLLTEFGYDAPHDGELKDGGDGAKKEERNARDKNGLLLHNSLMAGLASGYAGAPMTWWWDRSVDANNLWPLFKGAALFMNGQTELINRDGALNIKNLNNDQDQAAIVRILGRVGKTGMTVWVQDRRSTWSNLLVKNEPPPAEIKDQDIILPPLQPGQYVAHWIDAWKGEESSRTEFTVAALAPPQNVAPITLRIPPFKRDVGLLIEPK